MKWFDVYVICGLVWLLILGIARWRLYGERLTWRMTVLAVALWPYWTLRWARGAIRPNQVGRDR